MTLQLWIRSRAMSAAVIVSLWAAATGSLAGQRAAAAPPRMPAREQADDAAAFKLFSDGVQVYLRLQKTVESNLPALSSTDLPEMIAAHQQALARKIREARPRAKEGDLFTPDICEAFRHASTVVFQGPQGAAARAYMETDAADPKMRLAVNGVYPATAPITAIPPGLLAAFPSLPPEVAYRIVGRTLVLIDVKSGLVIDIARTILSLRGKTS